MKTLHIFLLEWKHFLRTPFKIIALLLFILAAIYGLQNGSNLYKKQTTEVEKIQQKVEKEKEQYFTQYKEGKLAPKNRPWVDMSTPFWAIWYTPTHHIKKPSPAIVYSIGQAEQYGFYKRITFMASPYDADMAEEIANPERLQVGTLDFAFVILFLLPLLLLILLYNLQIAEAEQGFLPLIEVQATSKDSWLFSRALFYMMLCVLAITGLLIYGGFLTDVFEVKKNPFFQMLLYTLVYLFFWFIIYFFIIRKGKTIIGNTLKMIGVWLLIAYIIPGVVHQGVSITKPANLMTELIDANRDKKQELYDLPDSLVYDHEDLGPVDNNTYIYYSTILLRYYNRIGTNDAIEKRNRILEKMKAIS